MMLSAVCASTARFSPSRSTGKERDTESGNDYFMARYYASSMGRFMSPDWAESPSNVPFAKFTNPQSLNLYAYVYNNPLSHRDSDGHHCDPDYMTTNANGDTVVHAGACYPDLASWDLPGHAWVGLANLMTARTGQQAATSTWQIVKAEATGLMFWEMGAELLAEDGLTTLGLGADEAGADAVETGAQSVDVTTGKSIKNWKTDATPDQVGKTLESNGFKKGATSDGRIQYTSSDGTTKCTMYPKAKSTGGPSMQVEVNNVPVSKVRMK